MRNHTAALVLVAYQPPTPKSAPLTVLSPVLAVLLTNSPLIPPCLLATTHICEELGKLERKPSQQSARLQRQKVRLRCGVCVPAVSPRRQHDRRNSSSRPCAVSGAWHAVARSSVLSCLHARAAALISSHVRAWCGQPRCGSTSSRGLLSLCVVRLAALEYVKALCGHWDW
jgi:hypothetical protein